MSSKLSATFKLYEKPKQRRNGKSDEENEKRED